MLVVLLFKASLFVVSSIILSMFKGVLVTPLSFRRLMLDLGDNITRCELFYSKCVDQVEDLEKRFTPGSSEMKGVIDVISKFTMAGRDYSRLCAEELSPCKDPVTGNVIDDDLKLANKDIGRQIIDLVVEADRLNIDKKNMDEEKEDMMCRFFLYSPYLLLTPESFDSETSSLEDRSIKQLYFRQGIDLLL